MRHVPLGACQCAVCCDDRPVNAAGWWAIAVMVLIVGGVVFLWI